MGGRSDKLARWRQPCETAAAGEACDDRGESGLAKASNGTGERGAGRAERAVREEGAEGSVRLNGRPLHSITVKAVHDEILAQF